MKAKEKHKLYIGKGHQNPIILDLGHFKLEIKIDKSEDIEYILAELNIDMNYQYTYKDPIK